MDDVSIWLLRSEMWFARRFVRRWNMYLCVFLLLTWRLFFFTVCRNVIADWLVSMSMQHARVNGKSLPNFVGKNVFLVGTVKSDKMITTTDGIDVICNLPPGDSMNSSKFVHLVCAVTGNTEVSVTAIMPMDDEFDTEQYNEALELMNNAKFELQDVFVQ